VNETVKPPSEMTAEELKAAYASFRIAMVFLDDEAELDKAQDYLQEIEAELDRRGISV
jgi:hypothetical protein